MRGAIDDFKRRLWLPEKLAALVVWRALQREGPDMFKRMIGNKGTTIVGVLFVAFVGLCQGDVLPAEVCAHSHAIEGLLVALGFLAAKDAATGSAPRGAK